jgi:hypothetical protein
MGVNLADQALDLRAAGAHLRETLARFLSGKAPASEVDRAVEGWLLVRERP